MSIRGVILGEVGLASDADANEQVISYRYNWCYTDPVVVAKPISYNDSSSAVVRIWDVTRANFKLRIQNFIYGSQTDDHGPENVGYIVMEKGRHELQTGSTAEAGLINVGRIDSSSDPFITVNFLEPFPADVLPAILTSCNTRNEDEAVITRVKDVTNLGFKLALQEMEAGDQIHTEEEVAYIAIAPKADGSIGRDTIVPAELGLNPNPVTDEWDQLYFIRSYSVFPSFSNPPIIIADMQTSEPEDTPEPAELRVREVTTDFMELSAVEESSFDPEITHPLEIVGYAAFERNEFILGNGILLIFLMDESGSIPVDDFTIIVNGVADAINNLPVDGSIAVLVIKFGDSPTTIPATGITPISSEEIRQDLSDQVRETLQGGGETATLGAIRTAMELVSLYEAAGNTFRHKIALILTDGQPFTGGVDRTDDAIAEAETAWAELGIQINAIGFGEVTVDFLDRVVQPNPGDSPPGPSYSCDGFTPYPSPPEGSFWCIPADVDEIPGLIQGFLVPLPPGASDILVDYGPVDPVIADGMLLPFGTPKLPVGQIRLEALNDDATNINTLIFQTRKPTDDPFLYPYSWAYLYLDQNSDGIINPGEPQLGQRVPINPVTVFDDLDLTLIPGTPIDILLCYDVTCQAPNSKMVHWRLTNIIGGPCFSWGGLELTRAVEELVPFYIDEDIQVSLPTGLDAEFGSITPIIEVLIKTRYPMSALGLQAIKFNIKFDDTVLQLAPPSIANSISEEAGWDLDHAFSGDTITISLTRSSTVPPLRTCGLLVSIPFEILPGGMTGTTDLMFEDGVIVPPLPPHSFVPGSINITYP